MSTQEQFDDDMSHYFGKYAPGKNAKAEIGGSSYDIMRSIEEGRRSAGMLTYFDNKIYEGMPVSVGEQTILPKEAILVKNVAAAKYLLKRKGHEAIAGASGAEFDKFKEGEVFTDLYLGRAERGQRWNKLIRENPYQSVVAMLPHSEIRGAAGAIQTDYETIRRVNYLMDVSGPNHLMDKYNAIEAVRVMPTQNLNVKGFRRTAKLSGIAEIGDKARPAPVVNAYASYEKWLLADAFRYETTLRERQDSIFGLEAQFTQDIPGVFAELKDDKITTLMNAISDSTPTTDWDALLATYETHYTSHAEDDVAAADEALADYGGMTDVIWPRLVRNAYMRNIGGTVKQDNQSLAVPTQGTRGNPRIDALPLNPGIRGIVNNAITSASFVGVNRDQWAALLQGPVIQVTYMDSLTPGQLEGRIIFDYNGVQERTPSAGLQYIGLLS